MKAIFRLWPMMLILFTAGCLTGEAQKTSTKKLVDSQVYTFVAQRANPMTGASIDLTGSYDVTFAKDKIVVYLPYYGRAFTAPTNSSDGGIKFTSTTFDYTLKDGRNGSWDVTIKPKEETSVRELSLNFFDNGTATLQVTSDQRQPISFDGYIKESRKPNEKNNN